MVHQYVDSRFLNILHLPGVFQPESIQPAFHLMMSDLRKYLIDGNIHSIIILFSLISFLLHVIFSIRIIKTGNQVTLAGYYILYSVVFMVLIFWMPVITGTYYAKHILRYNMSAFYLAMLNLPLMLSLVFDETGFLKPILQKISGFALPVLIITLLFTASVHISKKGVSDFFDYYPGFVRELDEIAEGENLLNGVAHFWNAKPITIFSKQGLKVYHTFDPVVPYYHVTSKFYYTGANQVFNFIVISNFDDKTAYRKYLDHEGKMVKNGNTEVLILPPFRFDQHTGLPYFTENHQ